MENQNSKDEFAKYDNSHLNQEEEEVPYQPQITNDYPPNDNNKNSFNIEQGNQEDQGYEPQMVNYDQQQQQQYSYQQQEDMTTQNDQYQQQQQDQNIEPEQAGARSQQQKNFAEGYASVIRKKMVSYEFTVPECNFCLSMILLILIPIISQLADEFTGMYDFIGVVVFLLMLVFSIIALWAQQNKAKMWLEIYQTLLAVNVVGFLAIFVLSIVDLARDSHFNSKTVDIILLVISIPYSAWQVFSYIIVRDQVKAL